jgi:hypothetical protein
VTGNNASLGIDQTWIVKPECRDAGRNLRNLGDRMRSRISRVGNQFFEWPVFDSLRHRWREHSSPSSK